MVAVKERTQRRRPLVERIRRSLERLSETTTMAAGRGVAAVDRGSYAPSELVELRKDYESLSRRLRALHATFPGFELSVAESEHVRLARKLLGLDSSRQTSEREAAS